jgi:hypothetical protein
MNDALCRNVSVCQTEETQVMLSYSVHERYEEQALTDLVLFNRGVVSLVMYPHWCKHILSHPDITFVRRNIATCCYQVPFLQ